MKREDCTIPEMVSSRLDNHNCLFEWNIWPLLTLLRVNCSSNLPGNSSQGSTYLFLDEFAYTPSMC